MNVKIYGSRGSVPFFSRANTRGGNTSCVRLDTGGQTIIIDCGSGLVQFYEDIKDDLKNGKKLELDILLSHLHLDHLIGLPLFAPLFDPRHDIRIFTKTRDNRPLTTQVFEVFKPPYWPVDLEKMSHAKLIPADERFTVGEAKVTTFASEHDDDTTAFRIESDKTLVYLLDYEIERNPARLNDLVSFCENADAVIFDAAYFPDSYEAKKGWGHSTYLDGMRLAEACGCKKMIFTHFDIECSDTKTKVIIETFKENGKYVFAFDGLEFTI